MGNHHSHNHTNETDANAKRLFAAFIVNTVFFIVVLAGAFLSNSLTLFAEALHMVTDSASLILALFASWIANRPADSNRTYGYNRAEVLAGLINGVTLVLIAVYIVYDAYIRLQNPIVVEPVVIIIIGVIGLISNIVAASLLIDNRDNLNVEGAFLHLAVDAVSSFAVVVGGLIIYITGVQIVDPVLAVLISIFVLYSVTDLLRDSLNILLQGSPRNVDVDDVINTLNGIDGVNSTHHIHIWALDSSTNALSCHIVVERDRIDDFQQILTKSQGVIDHKFGIEHSTIQIEFVVCEKESCNDCYI